MKINLRISELQTVVCAFSRIISIQTIMLHERNVNKSDNHHQYGNHSGKKYQQVSTTPGTPDELIRTDCLATPSKQAHQQDHVFLNDKNNCQMDQISVLSGMSGRSKMGTAASQLDLQKSELEKLPWYKGITCKDVRDIAPTLLILIGGLSLMIYVIPMAFGSVIRQLKMEYEGGGKNVSGYGSPNATTEVPK